jgi:hypothetical protein
MPCNCKMACVCRCSSAKGGMTLPVSSYEELLAQVRSLTHETIQLQRELTTPVVDHNENGELSTRTSDRPHRAYSSAAGV